MRIYNTLTRKKDEFKEIDRGSVRMYTCGPTVYDYAHIGNFRAYICADLLKRYLKYKGYRVTQVMNITDVDDKTIRNSQEQGVSLSEYTERYTKAFMEDIKKLNLDLPEHFPRATQHIREMVRIIKCLMEKGLAYRGEDGSVYYDVSKFRDYGKLSGIKPGTLKAGARISQDEYEKDEAYDFALWKAYSKEDGDVFWETELGKGRPGWHIECSAMSTKYLGESFDIHTGGIDLVFPHHENEIAQSEGCFGKKFVNYWVHNEWLLVEGKKMSKSLGNFYTLRDLLDRGFSARAIRWLLLTTHYRTQLNFTISSLKSAEETIKRLRDFVNVLKTLEAGDGDSGKVEELINKARSRIDDSLDDDLQISPAVAVLFDFIKDVNVLIGEGGVNRESAGRVLSFMHDIDGILGVIPFEEDIPDEIMALVKEREEARRAKEWEKADSLREEIKKRGYTVDDTKGKSIVKKIRV